MTTITHKCPNCNGTGSYTLLCKVANRGLHVCGFFCNACSQRSLVVFLCGELRETFTGPQADHDLRDKYRIGVTWCSMGRFKPITVPDTSSQAVVFDDVVSGKSSDGEN